MESKISIALITYNHEKFIRQAIEGILIQSYSNYEIVVADDCSTDNTMEIIKEYQACYPEKFKILSNEMNMGASKNFRRLLQNCDGDYIALLDGDDFWIHPDKLQMQVDELEKNNEYVLCFHQARVLKFNLDAKFGDFIPPRNSTQVEFTMKDVLNDLFMPTASVVFRNGQWDSIPQWFEELIVCDKPLHLINLMHGKVKYIDLCMCVYRVHNEGVWSTKRMTKRIEFDENKIKMLNYFNEFSKFEYDSQIKSAIDKCELRVYINSIKCLEEANGSRVKKEKMMLVKTTIKEFFLNKKVYIFGTGEAGENCYKLLTFSNVPIQAFVDNDERKQGKELFHLAILSPDTIKVESDVYIVVGSMYYEEISEQLIQLGFKEYEQFTMYSELLITINALTLKGVIK